MINEPVNLSISYGAVECILVCVPHVKICHVIGIFPLLEVVETHLAVRWARVCLFLLFCNNLNCREHVIEGVQLHEAVSLILAHRFSKMALPMVILSELR